MTFLEKSFDVKISIIRPYITKEMKDSDLSRINQTTNLRYESLSIVGPQSLGSGLSEMEEEEVLSYLDESIKELDEIYNRFDDYSKRSEEAIKNIVFSYDVSKEENEITANAERSIFGSATGLITFQKYKKLIELEEILNREIQERMIDGGGTLDVVA